jgi:hypothetical protein
LNVTLHQGTSINNDSAWFMIGYIWTYVRLSLTYVDLSGH